MKHIAARATWISDVAAAPPDLPILWVWWGDAGPCPFHGVRANDCTARYYGLKYG
jgi:hypothetical protein